MTAMTLFVALAVPVGLAAQEEPGTTTLSSLPLEAQATIYAAMGGLPGLQVGKLTASDGAAKGDLGISVAITGNTVVAGAPLPGALTGPPGAAYVFVKPASGWKDLTETAKLSTRAGETVFQFGTAVAIDGDTIVVGATDYNTGASAGAVYVFVKPVGGWVDMTETAKLTASDGMQNDYLGSSVSISSNTVVASGAAKAYLLVKPTAGWADMTETAQLRGSDTGLGAVSIGGNTVVAGGPGATIGLNPSQGAAYVFVKPAGGLADMTQTAKLIAADGAANDVLGSSVSISGNTIVAATPFATTNGTNQFQGAAYVFVKPATGWTNMNDTAKLTASDGAFGDELGWSVSMSGNTVVAGAIQAVGVAGAAYVFAKPPTGWASMNENQKLSALDGVHGDFLGWSVSVSGNTAVAGAPDAAIGSNQWQGAAYVFGSSPVSLSPNSLGFSGREVGTSKDAQSTLANTGKTALTITSIQVTGSGAADYVQTNNCPTTLAGGATCTISVTFNPTQLGPEIASVTITDNDGGNPHSVALSGVGLTLGGNATLSATSLTFATQLVGATSPVQSITLNNYGTVALDITGITASGDFSESNTCGSILAVGATCRITVNFTPTGAGTRTGALSIADNAPGSPQQVSLTGTGTVVELNPPSLGFSCSFSECPPPPQTTTLTNTGTTALSITSITITGSTTFSQTHTCGTGVGAGKSCTITVTFNPQSGGTYTGSVSISDNGGGSPQMVPLSGFDF